MKLKELFKVLTNPIDVDVVLVDVNGIAQKSRFSAFIATNVELAEKHVEILSILDKNEIYVKLED